MTDVWLIYDWYMTDLWLIYDWYMVDIWLMLMLWPLAVTAGVTLFGAYHHPPDGHFASTSIRLLIILMTLEDQNKWKWSSTMARVKENTWCYCASTAKPSESSFVILDWYISNEKDIAAPPSSATFSHFSYQLKIFWLSRCYVSECLLESFSEVLGWIIFGGSCGGVMNVLLTRTRDPTLTRWVELLRNEFPVSSKLNNTLSYLLSRWDGFSSRAHTY